MSNTRWGEIKSQGCNGVRREYSAICWDAGDNGELTCMNLSASRSEKPLPSGVSGPPDEIEKKLFGNIWGKWFVNETGCGYVPPPPSANGNGNKDPNAPTPTEPALATPPSTPSEERGVIRWGDIVAKECKDKTRKYSARCWDAGAAGDRVRDTGSWEDNCAALDARWSESVVPAGVEGAPTRSNIVKFGNETWGEWFVPDTECGFRPDGSGDGSGDGGNGSDVVTATCFGGKKKGKHGQYRPEVQKALRTDQQFTLKFVNWIAPDPKLYTFLQSQGGALRTQDNVATQKGSLDDIYQFMFRKVGDCGSDNRKQILYGDRLQLYSVASNQYARCGAETCSLVPSPRNCSAEFWETFRVTSETGKVNGDPVCFGDRIRISQTVGDNADITAAGAGGVWAKAHGTHKNAVIEILPQNGSLYMDPSKEIEFKSDPKKFCANLCSINPSDPKCTVGECSSIGGFFSGKFGTYIWIALGVVAFIFIVGLIIVLVRRFKAPAAAAGGASQFGPPPRSGFYR